MSMRRILSVASALFVTSTLAACSVEEIATTATANNQLPAATASVSTTVPTQAQPTQAPLPTQAPPTTAPVASAGGAAQTPALLSTAVPQNAQAVLDAEEQIVAAVAQRAGPAVVRIDVRTQQGAGLGSGWLAEFEGGRYIITNNHVIADGGGQVLVSFTGLFQTLGRVVGTDPDSDVGVVQVEEIPEGVQPLELGDSSQVQVGQRTIAIGNPLGQNRTVTTGIVSALGRTISEPNLSRYSIGGAIQTDAAINPGNSGGPLFDSRGQVIGMNTAILSQSGTNSGIGFAVPINLIKKVASAIIRDGAYQHPFLGIQFLQGDQSNITTYFAKQNNLPSAGLLVQATEGGPLSAAGVSGEIILTAINGVQLTSTDDMVSYLELNTNPGDTVTVSYFLTSGGQQRQAQVTMGARNQSQAQP